MRDPLTKERLREFMVELDRAAPRGQAAHVYLVGGGTAVWAGWRPSTIDVDLHGDPEVLFRDIQAIKKRLRLNVEFVRPEDFVPPLAGSDARHVLIEAMGSVSFFHHDPYAQVLSTIVRGFQRDLEDADDFLRSGMVDADRFRDLVHGIPAEAYAHYPALSQDAVLSAVDEFLETSKA